MIACIGKGRDKVTEHVRGATVVLVRFRAVRVILSCRQ